jgi:hypothetical protein
LPTREDLIPLLLYTPPLGAVLALPALLALGWLDVIVARTSLGEELRVLVPLFRVVEPLRLAPLVLVASLAAGCGLVLSARNEQRGGRDT